MAAIVYAFVTPIGLAIGLGVRSSLALDAAGGAAATGILDAISSGILIYTATVELMAHEFVFVCTAPLVLVMNRTDIAERRTNTSTHAAGASSFTR